MQNRVYILEEKCYKVMSKHIITWKVVANRTFNRKRILLMDLWINYLKVRSVKCYTLSVELNGTLTWTIRKSGLKTIEILEILLRRYVERIKWDDEIQNLEVLIRLKEAWIILTSIKKIMTTWIWYCLRKKNL